MTTYLLDLFGVFVFALSGAMAADRRRMDLFGFAVIALLPALGGGTLRDIIIDAPVFWLADPTYLLMALLAAVLTFLAANAIHRAAEWLVWADAVGLSLFCVLGAAKTLALGLGPVNAILMGVMTAVVGGIIRDVVCNEVPLILRRDVYATAAFAGAAAYVGLDAVGAPHQVAIWVGAAVCFGVRAAALIWKLSLPRRGQGARGQDSRR
ncbi:MAG: trimeric intracellular cation channel family protein [Pseudomonadales bacterium]